MYTVNPVKKDCKEVVENSSYVSINKSNIPQLVEHILKNYELDSADWDAPVFPSVTEHKFETIVDFFTVGNAINYCFNDLKTGQKYNTEYIGTKWAGSYGMWASIKRAMENDIPILDSDYLQNITEKDLIDIFDSTDNSSMPMIKSRVSNLRTVGNLMNEIGGSFETLFTGDIKLYGEDGIVNWFANTEAFKDTRTYNGKVIRFDKRSQLTVSMLYGKFKNTEHEFDILDIDSFTVFADYGIPAGLVAHDVLDYDKELYNKIKNNKRIPENSDEEIEIRAATVMAGRDIKSEIEKQAKTDVSMVIIDYLLWKMRNDANTYTHITETTSY